MAKQKQPAKVTRVERTADGRTVYIVSSQTNAEANYRVIWNGRFECGCQGFHFRSTCAHVKTAAAYEQELADRQTASQLRDTAPLYRDNKPFSIWRQ